MVFVPVVVAVLWGLLPIAWVPAVTIVLWALCVSGLGQRRNRLFIGALCATVAVAVAHSTRGGFLHWLAWLAAVMLSMSMLRQLIRNLGTLAGEAERR